MTAIALIQARMGSARLPGKVLLPLNGRQVGNASMLARVVERVNVIPGLTRIVVCTTMEAEDDAITRGGAVLGWYPDYLVVYRAGCAPDDVLGRFALAALAYPADFYVRITADCPLLDPWLAGQALALAHATPGCLVATTPGWPDGLDVEVFSADSLFWANAEAQEAEEREHLTTHMRAIRAMQVVYPMPTEQAILNVVPERYRKWSVDTQEDYERVAAIYRELPPNRYSWRDTCAAIKRLGERKSE